MAATPGAAARAAARHPVRAIAALAAGLQIVSATWLLKPYVMPNAALEIATNLHDLGRYQGGSWARLKGTAPPTDPPLRSFQLPGEPLYLAAGLSLNSPRLFKYWHVPVAVALIAATAAVAATLFGGTTGLAAGIVAVLDPVLLLHGPVYDDTYLAAALVWLVVALLVRRAMPDLSIGTTSLEPPFSHQPNFRSSDLVAAVAVGLAVITRTEAQLALGGAALFCLLVPKLRSLRRTGLLLAGSVVIVIGAWAARNWIVQHHLLFGSTHDGVTLWESNGPYASRALARGQVDAFMADSQVMGPLWQQTRGLDEVEADAVFRRVAVHYILEHPGAVIWLGLHKAGLSFAGVRPDQPLTAPRNVVSVAAALVLFLLAAAGLSSLVVSRTQFRHPPSYAIPGAAAALLGLSTITILVLGPAGQRYWILWRPVIWILAGAGASRTIHQISRRTMRDADVPTHPHMS